MILSLPRLQTQAIPKSWRLSGHASSRVPPNADLSCSRSAICLGKLMCIARLYCYIATLVFIKIDSAFKLQLLCSFLGQPNLDFSLLFIVDFLICYPINVNVQRKIRKQDRRPCVVCDLIL